MKTNKTIRIAQVIGKLNAAGVESVINNYYKFIDHSKYQFDYFIDSDGQYPPKQELIDIGAKYYIIPPYQNLIKHVIVLTKLFKENKYQIVHSNMNTLAPISLFCAWLAGVPIRINHNHSTSSRGEYFRNVIKYLLRPFAKCFATNYVACSKVAAKWLFGSNAVNNGSVMIFNNAIDITIFKYNENSRILIRKEFGLNDKFVIGHVGRFEYVKNHNFIIELFKRIHDNNKNSILLLVGTGSLLSKIKKKVSLLGLEKCVFFLGVRDDVFKIYSAMDVFILPSYSEGLGMVGIEAQAVGLPCIFSNQIPSEAKILKSTIYLPIDKIEEWEAVIHKFMNFKKEDVHSIMCQSRFNIVTESRKLEDFYDKLISSCKNQTN